MLVALDVRCTRHVFDTHSMHFRCFILRLRAFFNVRNIDIEFTGSCLWEGEWFFTLKTPPTWTYLGNTMKQNPLQKADIDGDGDDDLVQVLSDVFVWFENVTVENEAPWARRHLVNLDLNVSGRSTSFGQGKAIFVDLNQDGLIDILALPEFISEANKEQWPQQWHQQDVFWHRNIGGTIPAWDPDPIIIYNKATDHLECEDFFDMELIDLNMDDAPDIFLACIESQTPSMWIPAIPGSPGSFGQPETYHVTSPGLYENYSVHAITTAYIDDDPYLDLLTSLWQYDWDGLSLLQQNMLISWHSPEPVGMSTTKTVFAYSNLLWEHRYVRNIHTGYIDNDDVIDVLACHYGGIWYYSDPDGFTEDFELVEQTMVHNITDTEADLGCALYDCVLTDFDNDNDPDIVAVGDCRAMPHLNLTRRRFWSWYENFDGEFVKRVFEDPFPGDHNQFVTLTVLDANRDGLVDVLFGGQSGIFVVHAGRQVLCD